MEKKSMADQLQLVVFRLEAEEFGVEILKARGIHKIPRITPVPEAPEFVEGVFNLAGEIIPLVDLRKRFDMNVHDSDNQSRVVIVEVGDKKLGMIVDTVEETLWVPLAQIEPPPAGVGKMNTDYIKGICKVQDRLIVLLNLEQLLTTREVAELDSLEDAAENMAEVG